MAQAAKVEGNHHTDKDKQDGKETALLLEVGRAGLVNHLTNLAHGGMDGQALGLHEMIDTEQHSQHAHQETPMQETDFVQRLWHHQVGLTGAHSKACRQRHQENK